MNMKKILLVFAANIALTFGFRAQAQEYVDLGLRVNWAAYNVGAKSMVDTGLGLFLGTKYGFRWGVNPFKEGIMVNHEKDYTGNAEFDAATDAWGAAWRTPTYSEWSELIERCTWKWCKFTDPNGVKSAGYEVTGPNGNKIYLPAAKIDGFPFMGLYQCSTPVTGSDRLYCLMFKNGKFYLEKYKYISTIGASFFPFYNRPVTNKE